MTRKLFLIAVAVFAAIAGIVFFEVELQRFAAVRAIDGALIEHFFVELDGIAALRAGDFVIAFVFVVAHPSYCNAPPQVSSGACPHSSLHVWHDPIAVRHADECVTAKNGTVAVTALAHDKTAHGHRQNRIRPSVKSRRKPVNKVLDDVFAAETRLAFHRVHAFDR